ncbi:hypothetical protein L0F63_005519 [Massospora cicadina]|nr:hypothetical protein L0F63_005519 [Massospora cicadina]
MVIDNAPTVAEVDETAGLSELCINNGTAEKDEILDSVECLKKEIEDTTAEQVTNELEVLNLGKATNPVKKKWPKKEKKPDPPLFLKGSEEPISKENLEHYHSQKLAIKASDAYLQSLEKINEEVAKIEPVEDWNDVPHEAEDPEKPFFEPCLFSGLVEPPAPWSELPEEPKVEAPKAPEPEAVIDSWLLVPPVDEDDELIDESDGSSKETYSETSDFSDSDEFLATYARTARFYTSATPDT